MMSDLKKHRRQAAWLCFEPYLSEPQRIQAIQILERGYQIDSVSNLIAYVTKICTEFGIEGQIRKSLYTRFHQLMTEELPLSIDPLTFIFEIEPHLEEAAKIVEPKPTWPETKLTFVEPEHAPEESTAEKEPLPDHSLIFVAFAKHVVTNLPDTTALFAIIEEEIKDRKQGSKELAEVMTSWLNHVDDFAWTEGLDEKVLASVVHQIYMGLCEIFGPIGADDAFHKAIASCEHMPEARRFSPSRFL